jgi:DNA/RNA-binding domain of Phe-tRNA-synthetase-like protein
MQQDQLFYIDAVVTVKFPEIKVGVAVIRDVTVAPSHPSLEALKPQILREVREQLTGRPLAELPRVQAYRRIYRKFGVDPGSRRPSAEALLRRVLDPTKELYRINTVVDAYNLSSVESQLPMAAYDFDRIVTPITLRFTQSGEGHRGIG